MSKHPDAIALKNCISYALKFKGLKIVKLGLIVTPYNMQISENLCKSFEPQLLNIMNLGMILKEQSDY